jgi:hypothetical protein
VTLDVTNLVIINHQLDDTTQTIYAGIGDTWFSVYPNETLKLSLLNPNDAEGTVKTMFYCDSWNYAAYLLVTLGVVASVYGLTGVEEEATFSL